MSYNWILRNVGLLVLSAILETGGIALIRMGLPRNVGLLLAGAGGLVAYGIVVNQGSLDYGRLMGVYIALFFVVSQVIALILFHQIPTSRTVIGGALIAGGGAVILT
jgi:small multidrug resistance family-3 protein